MEVDVWVGDERVGGRMLVEAGRSGVDVNKSIFFKSLG